MVRCLHVALLCVQESVADRPSMPEVILMLNSYSGTDPGLPLAPAFFGGSTIHIERRTTSEEQGSSTNFSVSTEAASWSVNEVSITELYPR
ncbi:hypothetical protein MKW94_027495 [Papaver nudicaule]|uniref:S-locus receptor kinase C-terminal domain-containing protein n=1 Tax=Papaver nudicaule TaxID=74823 RepID=A0AA41SGC9_PAPNU|nr:hypothetical protein [Papaver nudicaule]